MWYVLVYVNVYICVLAQTFFIYFLVFRYENCAAQLLEIAVLHFPNDLRHPHTPITVPKSSHNTCAYKYLCCKE